MNTINKIKKEIFSRDFREAITGGIITAIIAIGLLAGSNIEKIPLGISGALILVLLAAGLLLSFDSKMFFLFTGFTTLGVIALTSPNIIVGAISVVALIIFSIFVMSDKLFIDEPDKNIQVV